MSQKCVGRSSLLCEYWIKTEMYHAWNEISISWIPATYFVLFGWCGCVRAFVKCERQIYTLAAFFVWTILLSQTNKRVHAHLYICTQYSHQIETKTHNNHSPRIRTLHWCIYKNKVEKQFSAWQPCQTD